MKIIKPETIGDAELTASNVTEADETEWTSGATFAIDALCMVTTTANGASVASHRIYKSLANSNVGNDPTTDATKWEEVSATNRFKMFSNIVQDQTVNASSITVSVVLSSVVNSMAFINLEAESVEITVTDAVEGVVYDETYVLTSDSGIQDWYAYFFEPIVRDTSLTVTDLPPYAGATIDITITESVTAKCGACVIGQFADLGFAQHGVSLSIIDYSVKTTDDDGRVTITQGDYIDTVNVDVIVNTTAVAQVKKTLTDLRTEPVVWIPEDGNSAYNVFGYYREFDIIVSNPTLSRCSLEIEGLV